MSLFPKKVECSFKSQSCIWPRVVVCTSRSELNNWENGGSWQPICFQNTLIWTCICTLTIKNLDSCVNLKVKQRGSIAEPRTIWMKYGFKVCRVCVHVGVRISVCNSTHSICLVRPFKSVNIFTSSSHCLNNSWFFWTDPCTLWHASAAKFGPIVVEVKYAANMHSCLQDTSSSSSLALCFYEEHWMAVKQLLWGCL